MNPCQLELVLVVAYCRSYRPWKRPLKWIHSKCILWLISIRGITWNSWLIAFVLLSAALLCLRLDYLYECMYVCGGCISKLFTSIKSVHFDSVLCPPLDWLLLFFVELYSVINVSISIAVLVGFLFWFVRSLFAECLVHILIDTFRAILSDRPSVHPSV